MLFSSVEQLSKRKEADILVCPFWENQKKPKAASELGPLQALLKPLIDSGDFAARLGEHAILYAQGSPTEKRVLILGLGKENLLTVEGLRQAYAAVAKICQKKKLKKVNLLLPHIAELRHLSVEECLKGVAEGILLTNYAWKNQGTSPADYTLLKQVTLIGIIPKFLSSIKSCELIAEGIYLARDLINGNADQVTPQYLVASALNLSKKFPSITPTIFDKKRLEQEKMGLILAVSRGSSHDPALIILNYKGDPASKDHTVLVGKGVTFDTGGLDLKSAANMETMRDDMSGAAAVLAAIGCVAALEMKVNVTVVIPTVENAIDANSYKPGDVYISYAGKTVEIGNTDAEGRLILADALAYTVKHLKPSRILDFATLTGSVIVALGEGMAGLFASEDKLAHQLLQASTRTAETLWRMPLHVPYKEGLKSDIADLRNVGGKGGGSILAALFLQEFLDEKIPWAHIDMAGTAFSGKELHYTPKNGVGFGIRLIIDFLQHL